MVRKQNYELWNTLTIYFFCWYTEKELWSKTLDFLTKAKSSQNEQSKQLSDQLLFFAKKFSDNGNGNVNSNSNAIVESKSPVDVKYLLKENEKLNFQVKQLLKEIEINRLLNVQFFPSFFFKKIKTFHNNNQNYYIIIFLSIFSQFKKIRKLNKIQFP